MPKDENPQQRLETSELLKTALNHRDPDSYVESLPEEERAALLSEIREIMELWKSFHENVTIPLIEMMSEQMQEKIIPVYERITALLEQERE